MVYFTGDIHADIESDRMKFIKNLGSEDVMFVAGDFGYCWNDEFEKKWNTISADVKANILITPGNHENYEKLYAYPLVEIYGGKAYKMNEHTYYLKHGEIFNVNGFKILSFGGATSIDKVNRILNISWWPQEIPTYSDYANAITNLNKNNWDIDIFLTHTTDIHTIDRIFLDNEVDPVSKIITDLKEKINSHNCGRRYLNIFGHLHRLCTFDNTIGLYNTIIEVTKENDNLLYNHAKRLKKNQDCNTCKYSNSCPIKYDMSKTICALMFEPLK